MQVLQNVKCIQEAQDYLADNGIKYDRVVHHPLRPQFFETSYTRIGVHLYFMDGDQDVAYYTPIMQTLAINDKPRFWATNLLQSSELYAQFSANT